MITYKLSQDNLYAQQFINGEPTNNWLHVEQNEKYLEWVAEGNTPEPADEPEGE